MSTMFGQQYGSQAYISRNASRSIYPTRKGIAYSQMARTPEYKIAVLKIASTAPTVAQVVELLEELFEFTPSRSARIIQGMIRMNFIGMHSKAYTSS